jgi:hypothetical protein
VSADLIREDEMRIICDNCGMAISPGHLRFHTRGTIGPLLKLCVDCCAKEEAVICDCCGKVIPPGVMPHLRMAGLPIPFLHRLCIRCGQAANAMYAVIGDNSSEYDDFYPDRETFPR